MSILAGAKRQALRRHLDSFLRLVGSSTSGHLSCNRLLPIILFAKEIILQIIQLFLVVFIMADGIDRKAEGQSCPVHPSIIHPPPPIARIVIDSSRENGLHHFKGGDSRTNLRGHAPEGKLAPGNLCLWIRIALGRSVKSNRPDLQRPRHYCSSAIRYRKNCHILHQYPAGLRDYNSRDSR
jgi:hypothetical protein